MSSPETKAVRKKAEPGKPATTEGEPEARRGWLSWVVGWILVPSVVLGVIFGGGVLLGVHNHDGWFSRTVVWIVDLF
jgi:hypothetical protein